MAIQFKEVSFEYSPNSPFSFQALKNINLEIEEGKITAIVGATGSGKSTLVQHLNALLIPSSGQVIVKDKVIESNKKNTGLKALRENVGLVFQFPEAQLFEETILKDVMFGPLNFKKTQDEAKAAAIASLQRVGIEPELYNQSPLELSGGQKRRVAIAGILSMNPDILVCDEPTAGLDPQGSKQIMKVFSDYNQKLNKTVIIVTHDLQHVLDYADNVIVMKKGEVLYSDTKTNFFTEEQMLEDLEFVLPKVILTRNSLIKKGFQLDSTIITMDKLVEGILKEVKA